MPISNTQYTQYPISGGCEKQSPQPLAQSPVVTWLRVAIIHTRILNLSPESISLFVPTQIARLEQTWVMLRQRHTEGAILYEKKLKPFLKSLNEGKGSAPLAHCCVILGSFQPPSLCQHTL